ncbi:MAG: HAMP domain-containing histidine kinase [Gammaproteobacteria bacterium]|nr:HAMP domain-containing histidine kinase [Gammaproteobacteria bacterium]
MLDALKPRSLSVRLGMWYAVIFIVFCVSVFFLYFIAIERILATRIDHDLTEDVDEFTWQFEQQGLNGLLEELRRESRAEDPHEVFLYLGTREGKELFTNAIDSWDTDRLSQLRRLSPAQQHLMTIEQDDLRARIITASLGEKYVLQIGESLEVVNEFLDVLVKVSGATLFFAIAFGAVSGWLMSRKAMRDIREVSQAAIDVAHGRLERTVSSRASDREIRELTSTFNVMVERIRSLVFGMREMTDNIAHDLRSPLGRIRASAEQTLADSAGLLEAQAHAGDILEECDRLLHMIDTTLDVAETEMGVANLETSEVDISRMLSEACELFEPVAEDKQIRFDRDIPLGCRILANTSQLQRLIGNLLENALKYTPDGGEVQVRLVNEQNGLRIHIIDSGAGISLHDQSRVFDRFYRSDSSRTEPGCGLGLSLARAIARAHGGDISLKSAPGMGSEFIVQLPTSAPLL